MARAKGAARERTTCPVALDGEHRWVEPKRTHPPEQMSLQFSQCSACGAVLWTRNGHIDAGLTSGDGIRR